ncbi:MAG: aminoacetone oxidase family FAD-binding enzyme [Eggerthellales bacterium]|nr:aminoacetone oxidase family FAD-binding enzyme [Eggerthellales bacterium]
MSETRIAIVGAGAAGLVAAIVAARKGAQVTLFEAKDRVGSSILATGNGRCNISNSQVSAADYLHPDFVEEAFGVLPPQQVWDFFADLGLCLREEAQGRMYPVTNKASSVLDVLRFAADEAGVAVEADQEVHGVTPAGSQQLLYFADGTMAFFDRTIVAVGGKVVQPLLPVSYPFAETRPVLCALQTDTDYLKGLDNIRVRGAITLTAGRKHGNKLGQILATEEGEVQFRKYGVSGVAVFNLSRFAQPGDALSINLLPEFTPEQTAAELARRRAAFPQRTVVDLLAGMVLPAVARCVLKQAGVGPASDLDDLGCRLLAEALHGFTLVVQGFQDQTSQVTRGGFKVDSFNPRTMESETDQGLYLTGEALDIDGPCGGYNLHWAFTSGMLAGAAAAGFPIVNPGVGSAVLASPADPAGSASPADPAGPETLAEEE